MLFVLTTKPCFCPTCSSNAKPRFNGDSEDIMQNCISLIRYMLTVLIVLIVNFQSVYVDIIYSTVHLHRLEKKCQALLNPIYTPSSAGYMCLIAKTTQDGHTFRFPLPNFLYPQRMYWRYAAFLKLFVE